jgi:hypothetical protein
MKVSHRLFLKMLIFQIQWLPRIWLSQEILVQILIQILCRQVLVPVHRVLALISKQIWPPHALT